MSDEKIVRGDLIFAVSHASRYIRDYRRPLAQKGHVIGCHRYEQS